MNFRLVAKKASEIRADLLAVAVPVGDEASGGVATLPIAVRRAVSERVKKVGFKGKKGASVLVQGTPDVVVVGLGEKASPDWRRVGAAVRAAARNTKAQSVALCVDGGAAEAAAAIEGFELADYTFSKYKSAAHDKTRELRTVTICGAKQATGAPVRSAVTRARKAIEGTCLARDLVNEMSGVKHPTYLAKIAKKIARDEKLRCQVWQGARLRSERMNGILAVSAGSKQPGALIKLVYKPRKKAVAKIVVVGKGITFDSGGLSLKPGKGMETMKMDMAGAAAVLGLMKALPTWAPPVEVHGIIASAENMPSGTALRPGDVITYRNGTTAEVLNTDAEGRLVLADALCLASELKPDAIVDLATLTGACMVALGSKIAGVLGNDEELIQALIEAGGRADERLWELPLAQEYADDIRSSVADIKNIGGGYAGTITAALFLERFVKDAPWAHLDIAGPAFRSGGSPYGPAGGTGFGVRTLLSWIDSIAK
ncbi:MAG: leucyl aminopeptidase [Hyphomicrobiaceae bacterium]|jgi:leucyl aminopeptidase